jgi:hypothetical protein
MNSYKRWAVEVTFPGKEGHPEYIPPFLAGKYCWRGARLEDFPIPTWRTKVEAEEAIQKMWSYRKFSKPKCVLVGVKPFDKPHAECHG